MRQYDVEDDDHFKELIELVRKLCPKTVCGFHIAHRQCYHDLRTYKKVWTRDRKKTGSDKVPSSFELVKALLWGAGLAWILFVTLGEAKRCENLKDWFGPWGCWLSRLYRRPKRIPYDSG